MSILHAALDNVWNYGLLLAGLGFVVFFHELGHFLAAKFVDVKVEQFAVGFGPAAVAWRKGIGFRMGTTLPAMEHEIEQYFDTAHKKDAQPGEKLTPTPEQTAAIAKELGFGETEYRLNWIPLGGYVKMLGQDDLHPESRADDPRSYNSKPIRSRMLIVSAGVIMNVFLAAIGFMILFMAGYPAPAATVGGVISDSPASHAARADGTIVGFRTGDQILAYDGKDTMGDFTRIILDVALTREGETVPVDVKHPDGTKETLFVTPQRDGSSSKSLLAIGLLQPEELQGLDEIDAKLDWDEDSLKARLPAEALAVHPGDTITQINGQDVLPDQIWKLAAALEASDGQPIDLTIRSADGKTTHQPIWPHLQQSFSHDGLSFLGLVPRARIDRIISEKSPALNRLKAGDVVLSLIQDSTTSRIDNPSVDELQDHLHDAGAKGQTITMTVLSPGDTTPHDVADLTPNQSLGEGKRGLGISLAFDEQHPVVAKTLEHSALDGHIMPGSTLISLNGQKVQNWFQVRKIIAACSPGQTMTIDFLPPVANAKPMSASVALSKEDIQSVREIALDHELVLSPLPCLLHTSNPIQAMKWGVTYTRDLILEFYVTLQRLVTGSISPDNMMGPIGMASAGAQFAARGWRWLLSFLALISANLAVVNFLPVPIVDGGLFTLLILEKIQGRPLSPSTQRIVQMAGLVLILGVFLLVTCQDIAHLAGY